MPALLQSDIDIANPIRCIIADVDGVMTDGRIIYDNNGIETKAFHVRDGLAIKLWMESGFQFGILTSRQSEVVAKRAAELGIKHVQQGHAKKINAANAMLKSFDCTPQQACYIGDDLPDMPVMQSVALSAAPADGAVDVRELAHWVLRSNGGHGALRELIERLLRAKNRWEEHLPV